MYYLLKMNDTRLAVSLLFSNFLSTMAMPREYLAGAAAFSSLLDFLRVPIAFPQHHRRQQQQQAVDFRLFHKVSIFFASLKICCHFQ